LDTPSYLTKRWVYFYLSHKMVAGKESQWRQSMVLTCSH